MDRGSVACFARTKHAAMKLFPLSTSSLFALLAIEAAQAQCWTSVSAGGSHTLAIDANGGLWAWGLNDFGQVGDGTNSTRTAPVPVDTVNSYTSISAGIFTSHAIRNDGTLWGWGRNTWGVVGDGTNSHRNQPVQVGTETDWTYIQGSRFFISGLRANGTIWAWGDNGNAQLGNGTQGGPGSLVPLQVGTGTNWIAISNGDNHCIGIRADHTAWVWGSNVFGALGMPSPLLTEPTQLGADDDWSMIRGGENCNLAIKLDGTLWGWGRNFTGLLGTGNTNDVSAPILISAETDWASLSTETWHSAALNTAGELHTFGSNQFGQLGNGTTAQELDVEHQPGSETWLSVSIGFTHSAAIREDGSLWTWGDNSTGQLGDGTFVQRNEPVEIDCVIDIGTSMHETQRTQGIVLWPNPAADRIRVGHSSENLRWAVRDLRGCTIMQGSGPADRGIDITSLPSGCYSLEWDGGMGRRVARFVKE